MTQRVPGDLAVTKLVGAGTCRKLLYFQVFKPYLTKPKQIPQFIVLFGSVDIQGVLFLA